MHDAAEKGILALYDSLRPTDNYTKVHLYALSHS